MLNKPKIVISPEKWTAYLMVKERSSIFVQIKELENGVGKIEKMFYLLRKKWPQKG